MAPQLNDNIESQSPQFNESEELKFIEEKLREKEKSLAGSGKESALDDKARHELLRDIIRERMRGAALLSKQNVSAKQTPPFRSAKVQDWSSKSSSSIKQREREEKLRKLVVLAFEKNIPAAVEETLKMPAYYIDALHDALVDKFFSELSRLGKI